MSKKIAAKTTSKRLLWADIIRIIAIYLVVTLHTAAFPLDKISVPLFVMLSGALLLPKKESYKTFFRKRSIKLLIPWIVWTFVYMIYFLYFSYDHQAVRAEYFAGNLEGASFPQWIYFFGKMFFSALWFLPLIFSLYLLTPPFRTFIQNSQNIEKYYILILWFLLFSFFPYVSNSPFFPRYEPYLFFTAFQYSGYFLLGYVLTKIAPTKKVIISLFILLILAGAFVKQTEGFLHPATVLCSIAVFYLVFALFTNIDQKGVHQSIKKAVTMISGACLGVYVIHSIVIGFVEKPLRALFAGFYSDFLLTFIGFSLSVLIVLLLQKIPIIKYIVPK